ncbi:MAG: tyrosine-type recombinase/integrase [Peptococcaceae bacterium]|jgi:integrase/recombinase XerD|nr:tyrosine-type recombinase/integrase [Peptococcaceae bacterium]
MQSTRRAKIQESPTQSEIALLLESAEAHRAPETALLLRLIAQTGVRASEVRHFTVEAARQGYVDLIRDRQTRRVPLPEALARDLRDFASERGLTAGALFTDRRGNPMSRQSVRQRLKRLAGKARLPDAKVNATALRNHYAENYLSQSADIPALSARLGYLGISERFGYPVTSEAERAANLNSLYD